MVSALGQACRIANPGCAILSRAASSDAGGLIESPLHRAQRFPRCTVFLPHAESAVRRSAQRSSARPFSGLVKQQTEPGGQEVPTDREHFALATAQRPRWLFEAS